MIFELFFIIYRTKYLTALIKYDILYKYPQGVIRALRVYERASKAYFAVRHLTDNQISVLQFTFNSS